MECIKSPENINQESEFQEIKQENADLELTDRNRVLNNDINNSDVLVFTESVDNGKQLNDKDKESSVICEAQVDSEWLEPTASDAVINALIPVVELKEESKHKNKVKKTKEGVITGSSKNEESFLCESCSSKFSSRKLFQEHVKSCVSEGKATLHIIVGTKENPYECPHCNYSTSRRRRLEVHVRVHTGEKPFKCSDCEFCCSDPSALRSHFRVHTGEKPFKCPECDYTASKSSTVKRHSSIHTGIKPYKCTYCDYSASQTTTLKRHIKRNHINKVPQKCMLCEYFTLDPNKLDRHVKVHTGENRFKCDTCDYSAPHLSVLKRHVIVHTNEKPFKCNLCEYSTQFPSAYKRHIRVHSGEKPYKCSHCNYCASDSSSLTKHKKNHEAKSIETFKL